MPFLTLLPPTPPAAALPRIRKNSGVNPVTPPVFIVFTNPNKPQTPRNKAKQGTAKVLQDVLSSLPLAA